MHEFALAQAVVDAALDTARREGIERLTRIVVRIGELQEIEREVFAFALREVLPASEPRLARAEFSLEEEPARFRCRRCDAGFALGDCERPSERDQTEAIHFVPELAHAFLRCPGCASPDFELVAGRGVVLRTLEGE